MELVSLNTPADETAPRDASVLKRVPIAATHSSIRLRTLIVLGGVWLISAFYMSTDLKRGWVPHDEGTFAQSAERVLGGELPHRDFDDVYTGGLSHLDAFAFRILGTNLGSLRLILMVFFLAWVPALFYIATRFASALTAGAVTLLAVAWSIPNYAAAVPSWYNLFFAVFGTAAILRFLETNSQRWLFLAGICGGLSILIKITGLYFVAAAFLLFIFREQCRANGVRRQGADQGRIYSVFVTVTLLLFVGLLCAIIRNTQGGAYVVHFVMPGATLVGYLLWREFQITRGNAGRRFLDLSWMMLPFGVGISLPIALYLIPYIHSGSLDSLVRGVFVLPQQRLSYAARAPAGFVSVKATFLLVALIAVAGCLPGRLRHIYGALVAVACAAVLAVSSGNHLAYWYVWNSLAFSIPVTAAAGVILLKSKHDADEPGALFREQLMLLLAVTAVWNLVQFPFAAPIYFCFVAPVLALTLLAVFSSLSTPRLVLGVLVCFYLLFAVLRMTPSFIYELGRGYQPDSQTMLLGLPRAGGIRVNPKDALLYEHLIPLVRKHAVGGYTYAAPDCPEVYFLSGLRNPTRTLFDFFDDPKDRTGRILNAIERNQVTVITISNKPSFSALLPLELRAALTERFPYSDTVGRFEVRWRE